MSMKFHLPPNAFPPLSLSRDEQRWLRDEMNAVVAETMRVERQCVDPQSGRAAFPKSHWKSVRSRDDFTVYKERRPASKHGPAPLADDLLLSSAAHAPLAPSSFPGRGADGSRGYSVDSVRIDGLPPTGLSKPSTVRSTSTGSAAWTSSVSGDDQDGIVASMKEPHVPMLVAAGMVDGTLDDTVFGALAGDELAWRLRTNYAKDKFADARILAKIDGPTSEDPFRSLCVKWFTKEVPALVGSFIQRRDFLILEATGSGVESDGTRFGFYLIHSIKLQTVPELSELNVIRSKVSLCFISRERSPTSSHLFARGFSDARGEMLESVAVALTAESIISATRVTECATTKKLAWLIQKQQPIRQQRIQKSGSAALPSECEACHRTLQKFSLTKHVHGCQACGLLVCAKCTVQKKLVIDVEGDGGVVERQLAFCFGCVLESKRTSSWKVAADAQQAEQGKLDAKLESSRRPSQRQHQLRLQQQQRQQQDRRHAAVMKGSPATRQGMPRSQSADFDFSASRTSAPLMREPRASMASPGLSASATNFSASATNFSASATNFSASARNFSASSSGVNVRSRASKSAVGVVLY
jgi:hypothetical protein